MGNVSSSGTLAPISLASTIIGFISFAFTLATFLRVFWENLQTFGHANRESRNILATLRVELEEERASLRELKRHTRSRGLPANSRRGQDVFQGPEFDEADIASLQAAVRRLTRRFEELERPFLADERELEARKARRRRRERSSDGRRRLEDDYSGEKGGGRYRSDGMEDDEYTDKVEDLYTTVSLVQRWHWLQSRTEARQMLEAVNRVQTRRIARQIGEIACLLHEYKGTMEDMRHGVAITEDRMSRVVGLRRLD